MGRPWTAVMCLPGMGQAQVFHLGGGSIGVCISVVLKAGVYSFPCSAVYRVNFTIRKGSKCPAADSQYIGKTDASAGRNRFITDGIFEVAKIQSGRHVERAHGGQGLNRPVGRKLKASGRPPRGACPSVRAGWVGPLTSPLNTHVLFLLHPQ